MLNINFTNLLSNVANYISTTPVFIQSIDHKYLIGRDFIVPDVKPVEEKEEIDGSFQLSTISTKLRDKIIGMVSDIHKRNILVNKALDTYSLLAHAVTYMTDPKVTLLNGLSDNEKALVNAAGMLAGFGKIYKSNKVANIDLYDVDNLNMSVISDYILEKIELIDFLSSKQFQKAMNRRNFKIACEESAKNNANMIEEKIIDVEFREIPNQQYCANPAFEMLNRTNNSTYGSSNPAFEMFGQKEQVTMPKFTVVDDNPVFKEPEPVVTNSAQQNIPNPQPESTPVNNSPIVTEKSINNITYSDNMDLGSVFQFENVFEKWIPKTVKHRYDYKFGFYYLYISRNDGTESCHIVDDGSIMGGRRISILGAYLDNNNQVKNAFVDVISHPLTTTNILNNPAYLMTPQEVSECWYDHLYNKQIYNAIDFHNTEFFDGLSEEDKYNFELTLLGVLNIEMFANVRFRIKEFVDAAHYTLVSDYQMFKPLPYIQYFQMPETYVAEGLEVKVDDATIHAMFNGTYKAFRMETM